MGQKTGRGDLVETARKPGEPRPPWLGGFIRKTKRGKNIYVIEKRIRGVLFKVSTRKHTEDAALKEFRRFEADPGTYDPAGAAQRHVMTPELILEYRRWQLDPPPLGRGNTYEWAMLSCRHLFDWLERLGGLNLRKVNLVEHVKPALREWKNGHQRITALKGFYTWLRKEKGLLKHHEDPMPDMRIPKVQAAKHSATGARDVPADMAERVLRCLRSDVVDILHVLSGTGWHLSEAMRFAQNGEIRKDPTGQHLAVLVTWHKRKEHAVVGLTKRQHVEAAERLRAQGYTLSRQTLDRLIARARDEAGVGNTRPKVTWGSMRHSVSTWAIEAGDTMENTAKAYNHSTPEMLRQHYVRHAVPSATIKTRVLK